ncbi:armadillo repeat-containing protein 7-like isoform X1 [Zingiber officinale]|uniref:armadillo repeat-containing protein 7-like isoform X1 n=1 Tax=Zingiber officinale TaxID=94328 RepID=UPI001C4D4168|nr:armadillo repeat-containing protein 7-like isoform X1 [Zingiber officinale]
MFTNHKRQAERTGRSGTPRAQYLQELVSEFQKATNEESKERIVANLANFAYDPYNYEFLRQVRYQHIYLSWYLILSLMSIHLWKQLNVLELFLDCITEPNEKLVEFGIGGICNSSVDPANAALIIQCDGVPLVIQCLSSPVRNTVSYALGALYYLCDHSSKKEILKPEVLEIIRRYAAAGSINLTLSNLANAFLQKHVNQ